MQDELHPAAFVEESFGDDGLLCWHVAQHGAAGHDVFNQLLGSGIVEPTLVFEPGDCVLHLRRQLKPAHPLFGRRFAAVFRDSNLYGQRSGVGQHCADAFAQLRNMVRKFSGARRRFPQPERHTGRGAVGVFDQHSASSRFNARDTPGGVPQQEDVARITFDGKVFIEGANDNLFRLHDDGEEGCVRNRPAACDRRQSRTASSPQLLIDLVAVKVGAISSALRCNTLGEHLDDAFKLVIGELPVRIGLPHERCQLLLVPLLATAHGDNLLGENVEWLLGNRDSIEVSALDGANIGRALHQVVASGNKEAPLGNRSAPVTGASDALQSHRDRTRRVDLANQVNVADVDAQF